MTAQCIACGNDSERLVQTRYRADRLWSAVNRWWINRRQRSINRRVVTQLRTLDEALLKDIGINRADVEWVGKLPDSSDATMELEIIARGGSARFNGRNRSRSHYRR